MWNVYCMNVTAVTATKNYTSQQHCLDVADIGEDLTGSLEVNQPLSNVNVVSVSTATTALKPLFRWSLETKADGLV